MKPDIIPAYDSLQEIGQMFTEYTDYLVEENPSVKAYLQIQDYEKELSHTLPVSGTVLPAASDCESWMRRPER